MATYLSAVELERKYEDQGLTAGRVRKWKERGKVKKTADGYCEEDVLAELTRYYKEQVERTNEKIRLQGLQRQIDEAKLRKITLEASLLEIEVNDQLSKLVWRHRAVEQWEAASSRAKAKIMSLGDELCNQIASMDDPNAIKVLLDQVTHQKLTELAEEMGASKDEL